MAYPVGPITHHHATKAVSEADSEFQFDNARIHKPVTWWQLFCAATVAGVPDVEETERLYDKVQSQALRLRCTGGMSYSRIAASIRLIHKLGSWANVKDALEDTLRPYRKSQWAYTDERAKVWFEKTALAGVLFLLTADFGAPLMPKIVCIRKNLSFDAADKLRGSGKRLVIYSRYNFGGSFKDAYASLMEKVERSEREQILPLIGGYAQ